MVTRKEVQDAFESDCTYNLIRDLFRHIVEIKKGYRSNDIGSEELCQFIKYARFKEKKISNNGFSFFKVPVYETIIEGRYNNIDLTIVRCGEGSGFFSTDQDNHIDLIFDNQKVCVFDIDTFGAKHISVYKRGEWLLILSKEISTIRREIDKSWLKYLRDQDDPLDDENFKL